MKKINPNAKLLTVSQTCEVLGVSIITLKRMVSSKTLSPVFTPGGHMRFNKDAVIAFCNDDKEAKVLTPLSKDSRDEIVAIINEFMRENPGVIEDFELKNPIIEQDEIKNETI